MYKRISTLLDAETEEKEEKLRDWTERVNIVIIFRWLVEQEIMAVRLQITGKNHLPS